MENIYNNFVSDLKQFENTYKNEISNKNNIIKDKNVELNSFKENNNILKLEITQLNDKLLELTEELKNFNKVSLLRKLHVKYDKINHKNTVLKQRVNYYKNKLLKNNIYLEETVDLTNKHDLEDKSSKLPKEDCSVVEITIKKEKDLAIEVSDDPEDFEEIAVDLIKIKKRFYYSEHIDDGTIIIYKAIKIKKGDYDVGDRIGILLDNKLVKD